MSKPLLTIFTPVYNHAQYLDEYFISIMNQSYENIELIIIDDASPDESVKVINKWIPKLEERFTKVIFIPRKENKGLIYNCNEGIDLANGKYICTFASDDVMLPANIKEKVSFLEQNPEYAMVYSDCFYGDNNNQKRTKFSNVNSYFEGKIFKQLIERGNFIPAPTVVLKKDIIVNVGGYSNRYMMEDYPMWIKISHSYNIGYINKPLVFYRVSPNSLSRDIKNRELMIVSQEQLLSDIEINYNINTKQAFNNLYSESSVFFYLNNKKLYKKYRDKIENRNFKNIFWDIMYFSGVPSKFIVNLSRVIKSIKRSLI